MQYQVAFEGADRFGVTELDCLAKNLKVLIWKDKKNLPKLTYREYLDFVASRCNISTERFREILLGEVTANAKEEQLLREYYADLGYELIAIREEFLFSDLLESFQTKLLKENLNFLLQSIPRGGNAEFIKAVDIDPSTLSRWKKGITVPDKYHLNLICDFYHLQESSLKSEFLFLDIEPVTPKKKKEQCKEWIDQMDTKEFESIYPAIKKLVK